MIKEALNPVLFPLFVELICSSIQKEDKLLAIYKRLVLPKFPIRALEETSIWNQILVRYI